MQSLSVTTSILAVVLMAGEWVLLVAGTRLHEMIVGAICVAAAASFLYFVHRASTLSIKLRVSDLAQVRRVPGYVAADTWIVVKLLLFSQSRASSFYRVSGFSTNNLEPAMAGRRILTTAYTTASPNAIVIGIDAEQGRMLFHQLQRRPLSRMNKALGAKP